MYFGNERLPKSRLDKYQKSIASDYPWTSNMVNAPEHGSNLYGCSFTIFIDYCEGT